MMRNLLFCLCLLLLSAVADGAEHSLVVGDFSGQPEAGILPAYWQPLEFSGVDIHTAYTHVVDGEGGVIQAESLSGSSGLVRKIQIKPEQFTTISWQWKIQDSIEKADLTRKGGDDASARLYITFAYDSSKVRWWEVVKFEAIKLFYGEYPPVGALVYVWASHLPQGTVLASPYTSRVKIIVIESGPRQKGQWLSEQRNFQKDYQLVFGSEDVPLVSGVAIMTDTDNTGSHALAWYGDIIFSE